MFVWVRAATMKRTADNGPVPDCHTRRPDETRRDATRRDSFVGSGGATCVWDIHWCIQTVKNWISKIQDGGRPPFWKPLLRYISTHPIDRFWYQLACWCRTGLLTPSVVRNTDLFILKLLNVSHSDADRLANVKVSNIWCSKWQQVGN